MHVPGWSGRGWSGGVYDFVETVQITDNEFLYERSGGRLRRGGESDGQFLLMQFACYAECGFVVLLSVGVRGYSAGEG